MTPHGSYSTYRNHGCRCELCRAACVSANLEGRRRRAALFTAGLVDRPHGVYTTYINYGCRCDLCKAAAAKQNRDWRARQVSA